MTIGPRLHELVRRIDRALEGDRGLKLTNDDLDVFVISGAYRVLRDAAVAEREANVRSRLVPAAGQPASLDGPDRQREAKEAMEALDRALAATGRPRRPNG